LNPPFTLYLREGVGAESNKKVLFIGGRGSRQSNRISFCMWVNESLYAAPHPHPQETAMRHVEDVEKKGTYTSKQTPKHKQKPKHNPIRKPSCAALEISTSRKRKNRIQKYPSNC
jgi:hypothetical protein